MALTFSGKRITDTDFNTRYEAFDGDKRIVVVASQEAIDDYKEQAVLAKASEKYRAGDIEQQNLVRVLSKDFIKGSRS